MANEMVDVDNPLFAAWAKRKHVVILSGYLFITEALMTAHSQKLRLYFSQLKGNQAQDLEPILQLRQECEQIIDVVIRHGGYDKWLEGKYYFSTADYIAWIRAAATLYPQCRTGFFLCSDSRQDLSGLEGIAYRLRAGHDLENRAALARCDMLISPPSSYSGWAA